uniref:DUF659 domain-containing protein n=1 Tax=Strongyloides venezuelensis TaxID=75913 RepID=A0A0K0EYQ9_STRVS
MEIKEDSEEKAFTLHPVKISGKIYILDGADDCNISNLNEIFGCYNSEIKKDSISRYETLVTSEKIDENKQSIDICITGDTVASMFADQINSLSELPVSSKNIKVNWFLVADMKFICKIIVTKLLSTKDYVYFVIALVKLQKELESINVCIKDYLQTLSENHIRKILNSITVIFEKFTDEEMDELNLS